MNTLALALALASLQAAPSPPAKTGVVTGHLRMPDGSPVAGMRVAAVSADSSNPAVLASLGQTDPAGAYRLEGVPPGRYYLMAGLLEFPTYYPGVKTQADAKVLNIASGTTTEGIDFALARPLSVRVTGQVSGLPPAIPSDLVTATLNERTQGRGAAAPSLTAPVANNGKFEFSNVTPGSYDLRIQYGSAFVYSERPRQIDVDDQDVSTFGLRASPMIFGRVSLDDGGSLSVLPPPLAFPRAAGSTNVTLGFRKIGGCCGLTTAVRADGWFAATLGAGQYQLFVSQLPIGLNVLSAKSGPLNVLEAALPVGEGGITEPLQIALTRNRPGSGTRGVRVSGRLTGLTAPVSGAILLSGNKNMPDLHSGLSVVDLQRIGQVEIAADGSFIFEDVPPGDYSFWARLIPQTNVLRNIAVPGRDVDRLEVKLSQQELDNLQGVRTSGSMNGPPQIAIPPGAKPPIDVSTGKDSGSLVASQRRMGPGPEYMEGAYYYFLVASGGSIVEEKRLTGDSVSFSLPAGNYELRAYARPCDGSCGHLDSPTDECRASFTLKAGETLAVEDTLSGQQCTLRFISAR